MEELRGKANGNEMEGWVLAMKTRYVLRWLRGVERRTGLPIDKDVSSDYGFRSFSNDLHIYAGIERVAGGSR